MPEGKPLVLLPGLLCDARLWRDQVRDLAADAHCTVADLTLDDSVAAMAERVLNAAPPRFALAALSMGGYVAFEIMRRHPERVIRLALIDTTAAPDSQERANQRRGAMASLGRGRFLGVTDRILPQLVHHSHLNGSVGNEVKAMAERVGGPAFLRQQDAILNRPDSRPLLGCIRVPTVVAVGDADVLTPPAESREMHRNISGAQLHVFEQCGHLPPMEKSLEMSALLRRWLGGHQSTTT